jgi:hypothetical protein
MAGKGDKRRKGSDDKSYRNRFPFPDRYGFPEKKDVPNEDKKSRRDTPKK